ncbi:multidrug effflux MFS transporter [Saccharospirillum impatiens]|uniref:multidrug effflux MFS transporter n=1 Tax=Saccharospirillum impatiens TaxID=169438 RepID=UPI00040750E3|nr:multidrug effflux MFS transporter [Saccharospirillum impatiens]
MSVNPAFLILILTLLLGLQPFTTDLYLPALPYITASFDTTVAHAQLTLSVMLLAFGASQLVWGPVSDRYGRRPVLLAGLGLYALSAVGAALAPAMEWLIGWRLVQGIALGAAVMCARALVRDLFDDPVQAAHALSRGLSGLGVLACISAPTGALLTAHFGWQFTFVFLALFSFAVLLLIALRLDETLREPRTQSLKPSHLLRTWRGILTHHTFWSYALLQAATYGGLYVFLASSSFVFIGYLNLSATHYGIIMFSMSASYIGGTLLCRRLLLRISIQRTVVVGGLFAFVGSSLMILLVVLGFTSLWALLLPFYVFMVGHGINQPCAQSGVMGPFPHAAGAASALSSLVMVIVSFLIGLWLGQAMDGSPLPMALGIWFCGLAVAIFGWGFAARIRLPAIT